MFGLNHGGAMPLAILVSDPLASTLLVLALLWLAAKLGGEVAVRFKLPAVAGQISVGVFLAALPKIFSSLPDMPGFLGFMKSPDFLNFLDIAKNPEADVLAYVGIVLLMFMVGLESSVSQMMQVGWASMRVAVMGVVGPMALGLTAAYFLLPAGTPFAIDLFIGACLCATSIGISASVLRERNAAKSGAGRVVIGAAVIDDVLGLLVLVAVSGLAVASAGGGALPVGQLAKTLGLAFLFLAAALTLGRWLSPLVFAWAARFKSEEILLPFALAFAFVLAYLGSLVGLATIVGAYTAGLILEHHHVGDLQEKENRSLEEMVQPVVSIFAPLFFVLTGASVETSALLQPFTIAMALLLTVAGIAGKYVSGYVAGSGLSVSVIGWGMVPRGEVGLIFVSVGRSIQVNGHPLLSAEVQAGVLGAILLTTILGPIGLSWVLGKTKGEVK
jgi:Kef-type K+ transport system membrane component KefB